MPWGAISCFESNLRNGHINLLVKITCEHIDEAKFLLSLNNALYDLEKGGIYVYANSTIDESKLPVRVLNKVKDS